MPASLEDLLKEMTPRESTASKAVKGAGMVLPGVTAAFGRGHRRELKERATHLEDLNREKLYGFRLQDLLEREGELQRQGERTPGSVKARAASMGASGGSQEQQALEDAEHQQRLRQNQINQQRAALKWGKEYGDEVRDLQKAADEMNRKEAQVNAILGTALWVGEAALTGGTSAIAGGPLLGAGIPSAAGGEA